MSKAFFITGTGTAIGKTVVTCSIIRQLRQVHQPVIAIKPLISGWDNNCPQNDTLQIINSLCIQATPENIDKISPWRFTAPLAPSMAAKIENKEIDYAKVVNFCKQAAGSGKYLLCEGAGGVMVPLNQDKTTLDLMGDLGFNIILVSGTYLGSISHTLTAVKAIELSGLKIHAIIVNESSDGILLNDTIRELQNFTNIPIYPLRRIPAHDAVWENTENILEVITGRG